MPRNSFIQMTKLHNVRGRIYYISSPKKQENLYAVYETTDRNFWTDLAKYNQAEFKNNGMEKSRSLYTIGLNLRNRTLGSES